MPALSTPTTTSAQAPERATLELHVYDGRALVGVIRERGKRHIAFNQNRKRIGGFKTRRAAMRAIPKTLEEVTP